MQMPDLGMPEPKPGLPRALSPPPPGASAGPAEGSRSGAGFPFEGPFKSHLSAMKDHINTRGLGLLERG